MLTLVAENDNDVGEMEMQWVKEEEDEDGRRMQQNVSTRVRR